MATTTNHYDLIVLGSDVAGLVAAALVARRGKRVLVIPDGPAEGTYRLGGRTLTLDSAPVIHMGTPPVRRVFHELGLLQQVRRHHAAVDGLVHLVLPDHRLDLAPCEENLPQEAEREWPGDPVAEAWALRQRWSEATDEVFDQLLSQDNALVADGFWGRRFLTRVAAQLPDQGVDALEPLAADHPMRAAARAVEPWLQHLTPAQLGKAASLRLLGLWSAGPEDLPRSQPRLRELLLQRIELHSGEVKPDLRVAEVLLKRGRVVGVSLLGKRDRYGCDHMIVATDPRRLLDATFAPEQLSKPLTNTVSAIGVAAHRFVLHLEVEQRGLSPALSGMVVAMPRTEELAADPEEAEEWAEHGVGRQYLRIDPVASDDTRWICVTRIIRADEPVQEVRETILTDLDERGIMPFCRPYLRTVHSPHDGLAATDGRGEVRDDLGGLATTPSPMAPLYLVHGDPSLGVGILPHNSGIKSLYFASRLTLPGLGLEGEFAAGTMAAGLVANPAKSPFSRSPLLSRV